MITGNVYGGRKRAVNCTVFFQRDIHNRERFMKRNLRLLTARTDASFTSHARLEPDMEVDVSLTKLCCVPPFFS